MIYSTSCTQWQINREISDADRRETGMSVLPLLFLIALDWVTREAYGSSDKGLRWPLVSTLEDLEFADDIALLTHRLQDIRCKIEDLEATGEKVGLKMSVPS